MKQKKLSMWAGLRGYCIPAMVVMVVALFAPIQVLHAAARIAAVAVSDTIVYEVGDVDEEPSYPGGEDEFMHFLINTVRYPVKAQEYGMSGRAEVSFIVRSDGRLDDFYISTSTGHIILDEEAMRVARKMKKWVPGKKDGVAVDVRTSFPVTFRLQNNRRKTR
jgi:TonB family protein